MDPNEQPANQDISTSNMSVKQQIAEQLKTAGNIVVTTNKKPSLDEVAAVIGLAQLLHKMGKHTTGVLSTKMPKAAEFLNPADLIHADTKRLQDFVISLHKDKVDKLRYKLDGDQVKVFMTPYKAVIVEDDLTFTQGDYNIDTVIAIGVVSRNEIDDAMLVSPRILADAKVVTVNNGEKVGTLGSLNWSDPQAVSVTEMVANLSDELGGNVLATDSSQSLLTGIVAVTEQFANHLTTPKVMTLAAQLMAAGADPQYIVKNLKEANALKIIKEPAPEPAPDQPDPQQEAQPKKAQSKTNTANQEPVKEEQPATPEKSVDDIRREWANPQPKEEPTPEVEPTPEEPHIDVHPELPTLKKPEPTAKEQSPATSETESKSEPASEQVEAARAAVMQAEEKAEAPHDEAAADSKPESADLDAARDAVKMAADSQEPKNPEPLQALNAQNVDAMTSGDITIDHNGEVQLPQ